MKLCQKCIDEIVHSGMGVLIQPAVQIIPESECEFWAHKKLNEFIAKTVRME